MNSTMVVDSEIIHLSIPHRYILFAEAYAKTAESLTENMMREEKENTWPNASVVLMNAAHAVELLLKGLLLKRDASAKLDNHDIEDLYKKYLVAYSDGSYSFKMPFTTDYGTLNETEIKKVKKEYPKPSILYRYPTKSSQIEWSGARGFIPELFISVIRKLISDIENIKGEIT